MYGKINDPEEAGALRKTSWIKFDPALMRAEVIGEPSYSSAETGIDYSTVFEFTADSATMATTFVIFSVFIYYWLKANRAKFIYV